MEDIILKLKNGERLSEDEIRELCWSGYAEDEIEGAEHRWDRDITTIINVDGQLYAVEWSRGLTEYQENSYYEQPYKVKKIEKTVTQTVVSYERSK